MRTSEVSSGGAEQAGQSKRARRVDVDAPSTNPKSSSGRPARKAKKKPDRRAEAKQNSTGSLPVLYMLSPQKYMSPFDCNMALDSGYKVVMPYDGVTLGDVGPLIQDAIFSRPPKSKTAFFIGGKDITLALDMMSAARAAMVPPFEVSLFADPGGSFTTAAAMVACVERALRRTGGHGLKGLRCSVFGATGVVGFASAVIAASEGAKVRIVAHDDIEQVISLAALAKSRFGVTLEPVAGQTDVLKAKILEVSDVVFTAGPAGINILPRLLLVRAPNVMVAADVNAVAPYGIDGIDLFMDGVPLPGCSTLGVGALAIGDVKYKTQAGLFERMLSADAPLMIDFRDAFALAREIVSGGAKPATSDAKPANAKATSAKQGGAKPRAKKASSRVAA